MLGIFKKVLFHPGKDQASPIADEPSPVQPAMRPRRSVPAATARDAQTPGRPNGPTIGITLHSILPKLPADLQEFAQDLGSNQTRVNVPLEKVTEQLATGAVRISFSDLRACAPFHLFPAHETFDAELVTLPLAEVLMQVKPARRLHQRHVEVPASVPHVFGALAQSAPPEEPAPALAIIPPPAEEVPASGPEEPADAPIAAPIPAAAAPFSLKLVREQAAPVAPAPVEPTPIAPAPIIPAAFAPAPAPMLESDYGSLAQFATGEETPIDEETAVELVLEIDADEEIEPEPTPKLVLPIAPVKAPSAPVAPIVEAPLSAQALAEKAVTIPGVRGFVCAASDGLLIAGVMPAPETTDVVAAFLPSFLSRLKHFTESTKLGGLDALRVVLGDEVLEIRRAGSVLIAVLLDGSVTPDAEALRKITLSLQSTTPL